MTNNDTDRDAVDSIAALLGTAADWYPAADYLDTIVEVISRVRPNPGSADGAEYRDRFYRATGRVMPDRYAQDLDDVGADETTAGVSGRSDL